MAIAKKARRFSTLLRLMLIQPYVDYIYTYTCVHYIYWNQVCVLLTYAPYLIGDQTVTDFSLWDIEMPS